VSKTTCFAPITVAVTSGTFRGADSRAPLEGVLTEQPNSHSSEIPKRLSTTPLELNRIVAKNLVAASRRFPRSKKLLFLTSTSGF
jgi:hypothetical protein